MKRNRHQQEPEEEVLLEVFVKVKKSLGVLKLTSRALVYLDQTQSSNNFTLHWLNVKEQHVSSRTSPKAMIRLTLRNGQAHVIHILPPASSSPSSSSKNLSNNDADMLQLAFNLRDQVRDLIQAKIATNNQKLQHSRAGKGRTPLCNESEVKLRALLLATNPVLKKQHTEMVGADLISEEDFWISRRHLIANEASKRQKIGKTSAILTDFAGGASEENGKVIKYNLNAEIIHQIFIQYPAIHRAYKDQVPERMSEKDFWGTCFKSKYFHRDRHKSANAGHEDLFTKYEELEEKVHCSQNRTVVPEIGQKVDPLVDLSATSEDHVGLKTSFNSKQQQAKNRQDRTDVSIAKFNRHGNYVLDPSHNHNQKIKYHDTIENAIDIEDLRNSQEPEYIPLEIGDEKRYFERLEKNEKSFTLPDTNKDCDMEIPLSEDCEISLTNAFPSSDDAMSVLKEIDNSVKYNNLQQTASGPQIVDIPEDFKKDIYEHFYQINELFRHYWAFKTRETLSVENQAKIERIKKKMEDKMSELHQIRISLPPSQRNTLSPLLKLFSDQLNLYFI